LPHKEYAAYTAAVKMFRIKGVFGGARMQRQAGTVYDLGPQPTKFLQERPPPVGYPFELRQVTPLLQAVPLSFEP
jgi:hypothetical protein